MEAGVYYGPRAPTFIASSELEMRLGIETQNIVKTRLRICSRETRPLTLLHNQAIQSNQG